MRLPRRSALLAAILVASGMTAEVALGRDVASDTPASASQPQGQIPPSTPAAGALGPAPAAGATVAADAPVSPDAAVAPSGAATPDPVVPSALARPAATSTESLADSAPVTTAPTPVAPALAGPVPAGPPPVDAVPLAPPTPPVALGRSAPAVGPPKPAEDRAVTVVLTGDTGFNGSGERVSPTGGYRHGRQYPWDSFTRHIASHLDGDINFANVETVVTANNAVPAVGKTFNFRTHPNGVAHLIASGVNLVSTANNHSMDYGRQGILDTIAAMSALSGKGLLGHSGVAVDRDAALTPARFAVKGRAFAFTAIGIGTGSFPQFRAGRDQPGQLAFHTPDDFSGAIAGLGQAPGAYRMLSVHYGTERAVYPPAGDAARLRDEAITAGKVDLVIGHHAHVPSGVARVGDRVVVYGLGNFMHPGMANMAGMGVCRDYGLMLRVHLYPDAEGRLVAEAIEAIALTDMHLQPRRMAPAEGRTRMHVLNHLAGAFDHVPSLSSGVRFSPRDDGTGLFCSERARGLSGRIGRLCRDNVAAAAPSPAVAARVRAACDGGAVARGNRIATKPDRSARDSRKRGGKTRLSAGGGGSGASPSSGAPSWARFGD